MIGIGLSIWQLGSAGPRISFSGSATVPDNTATSSSIGTFAISGGSGSYTYTFDSGGNPGSFFSISTATLILASALDHNAEPTVALVIKADNGVDTPLKLHLTITVSDATAPTVTSATTDSVNENATLAFSLTANETVTWSIVGGADQAQFALSGSTLEWVGNKTQDYETPLDADTNNTYIVTVRATDLAGNHTDQTITVTVADVDDTAPTVSSFGPADNATGVSLSNNLTVTFSESVAFNTSVVIGLYKSSDDSHVQDFTAADISGAISISGAVLTINPTSNLAASTDYYVLIGATSIKDLAGNFFAGIASKTTWNFTSGTASNGNDVSTVLLLHMDGTNGSTTFTDSAIGGAAPHTVTPIATAQISTAQSVFGGAAAHLAFNTDYLSIAGSADFAFGTGDFTIDSWVLITTSHGVDVLIMDQTNGPQIYCAMGSGIRYETGGVARITGADPISVGTWAHVALVRSSGLSKLYLNGTQTGSNFTDSTNFSDSTDPVVIGAFANGSAIHLDGYVDEFRISKVARWTTNFTPPVSAYS